MKEQNNGKFPLKYYIKEAARFISRHNRPYRKSRVLAKKSPLMIAHRGLSGLEKENTLPAFQLAGTHGYFGIETDVHQTADGKYVIIHDDTTGRVAESDISVEGSSFDALRALRLKDLRGKVSDRYQIPTLEEYVLVCKQYQKVCVLELKNHFEECAIAEIAGIIKDLGYLDRTIFISFDYPNLVSLRKLYPDRPAQYLTTVFEDNLIEKLKAQRLDLDIYFRVLNKSRVDLLHKNGIKINCWTVDSLGAARALSDWGVDYITTNIIE